MTIQHADQNDTEAQALAEEWARDLGFERADPTPASSPDGKETGESGTPPSTPPAGEGEAKPVLVNLDEVDIKDLFSHPKLAPQLQSRIDSTVAQQVKTRVDATRAELKTDVEKEALTEYLVGLTEAERATVLAEDPEAVKAWADHLRAEEAKTPAEAEAIAYAAQVYSYKSTIESYGAIVEAEPDLPDDIKTSIRFPSQTEIDKGSQGLVDWTVRVQNALISHRAGKLANDPIKKEAEQNQEEARAPRRISPITPPGRLTPAQPDLTAPSNERWDAAFARLEAQQRK